MVLKMPQINIEINKHKNRNEWYYIADVDSNKLSRHEAKIIQDLLSSISGYIKLLNFEVKI